MTLVHLQEKTQFTVEKVQVSYVGFLAKINMLLIYDCDK